MLLQTIKWFPQIPDPLSRHKWFHIIPILLSIFLPQDLVTSLGSYAHLTFLSQMCIVGLDLCHATFLHPWTCDGAPLIHLLCIISGFLHFFIILHCSYNPSIYFFTDLRHFAYAVMISLLFSYSLCHMQWWHSFSTYWTDPFELKLEKGQSTRMGTMNCGW